MIKGLKTLLSLNMYPLNDTNNEEREPALVIFMQLLASD